MAPPIITPVILELISVYDAALRRVRRGTEGQQIRTIERDTPYCLVDLLRNGDSISERISPEPDVYPPIACAKLIGHSGADSTHPAKPIILGQRRDIHWVTSGGPRVASSKRIVIEKCRFIIKIATKEV